MPGGQRESDLAPGGDLKRRWEERASEKGASLQSVLYRGFSEQLNQYVHDWHVWAVTTQLLPRLPPQACVLDLGCGYGRIRRHVADARPDLRVVGTDFSEGYCRLHAQTFRAETVCTDMRQLPFAPASFDGIIGVTSLMYLTPTERAECIQRILVSLKPSGHALFVDPGLEFMRLARFGLRSTRNTPTGGDGFLLHEYLRLDASGRFKTLGIGGIPLFTTLLPLLYLLQRRAATMQKLLASIQPRDFTARAVSRYSLQRWALLGPR